MIRLIGTDFDGTLLDDNKKVSKENIEILEEARKKNIKIVGITGRTLESVKNVVDIHLFDYLILNNGSNIYQVDSKTTIFDKSIEKEIAEEITLLTEEYAYQFDYCTFSSYHLYKNFIDQGLPFIKEIKSIKEIEEPISKINIFIKDSTNIHDLYERVICTFLNVKTIIMQDSGNNKQWLVVTPNHLNKREALKYLGEQLGISLSEMAFFGDGLNDVEVIESVGLGVAMGNALDIIKEKAKDTTNTNNENGIAQYIKQRIL